LTVLRNERRDVTANASGLMSADELGDARIVTVVVEPKGFVLDAYEGETVMGAAGRLGYQWPTRCGGEASCSACACEVRTNPEGLSAMERLERSTLERVFPKLHEGEFPLRLACQARVVGDVVVFKRGVRELGPQA
jgi:2Fe-2S ferredoxin